MKNCWSRLAQGETLMGSFISTGYPINTELMGLAGFDFLIIDLEHGMGSEREILSQLYALQNTPAIPVVRVESHDKQRVHRLLDIGVQGIMFPRVDNAAQARDCVAAMRYPPDGVRGVATIVRAAGYGAHFNDYRTESKSNLLTIIQIESAEAVKNVDEIAAVDGVDVLFVGPMDLSTSLGIFRQYDHPLFLDALNKSLDAARRHNRVAGFLLPSVDTMRHYRDMGFRFITAGTDVFLLKNAAAQLLRELRNA
ncbi:MAG: 2-dehydro-3-deoxyglucarate aldolase [Acidobacteria bacterium]|nr:2-dehydro-3-deoxyglucarate aldolase [Acidobacteriota bacterium]